jgi:FHA domain/FhaA, N-terminal domain
MKESFQKAELRLQSFLEQGLGRFSRSGLTTALIQLILAEMRDLTRETSGALRLAPDQFLVNANPKTWKKLRSDTHWMEKIRGALIKEASETGVVFQSTLRIDPSVNDSLEDGDFQVICSWQADEIKRTHAIATVAENSKEPALSTISGNFLILDGREYPLEKPIINIGRQSNNDLVVMDPRVSRQHAQIRIVERSVTIYDLGSSGGTFVNSQRITNQVLVPGDVISLAGCLLIYNSENDLAGTDRFTISSESKPGQPS